jgi:signal transduction histidine kinase
VEGDPPLLSLDETAIEQAVGHLLDNAIRHSPAGSLISVLVRETADQVHLDVWDQGAGIDPEDLPRIFDPFFRGRSGPDLPGAGLGLTLVKQIVDAHGGAVLVTSAPGHGSRFSVQFSLSKTIV